jgi:hypothetical protein
MHRGIRGWACVVLAVLMGCAACGTDDTSRATGALAMLLSTEVNGATYRLSAARFEVTGTESATLNSDDDPDASSLEVVLDAGNYDVLLRDGWRLEKRTDPGGEFAAVSATLVSPNPAAFSIIEGETTRVAFAFETDGVIVDLGKGTLQLVIDVTETSNPSDNCVDVGTVDGIVLEVFYTERSESNQIGMSLAVRSTGLDFAIADLVLRYWFTPGTTVPFDSSVDFAQLALGATTITDAVDVTFGATPESTFADITIDRGGPMGVGINTIQLRLFGVTFPNLIHTDDFSFVDGANLIVNENITAYVDGVQVFGCEPTTSP